jgi:DNA-directed RNA polymerase subunit RPC12/RpoP
MKPRNKNEEHIVFLSKKMGDISKKMEDFLIKKDLLSYCYFNKTIRKEDGTSLCWCSDCGQSFRIDPKKKTVVCPHCGHKLDTILTENRLLRYVSYLSIVTTYKGIQVERMFQHYQYPKKGSPLYESLNECYQTWIDEKGKIYVMAKKSNNFSYYTDIYDFTSEMSIKQNIEHWRYNIKAEYTKIVRLLPLLRHHGLAKDTYGYTIRDYIHLILNEPFFETLIKSGQEVLVRKYDSRIKKYAKSICICIRNKYIVKDVSLWLDYMDMLVEEGKDIHNAFYVCPKDLLKEHNQLLQRKNKRKKEEIIKENQEEMRKYDPIYAEIKKPYLNIVITDKTNGITIHPLQNIEEFIEEATAMHHCVFKNAYYKKDDSLILSARDSEGKRLETVEFDLKKGEVIQSRAVCDGATPFHDKIVDIVNSNAMVILTNKPQPKTIKAITRKNTMQAIA